MKIRRLEDAAGTGEVVDIVYAGGGQPGTRREITVRGVTGKLLKAQCLATGLPKTFKIELVEMWDGDPSVPIYDVGRARADVIQERRRRVAKRAARESEEVVLRITIDPGGNVVMRQSDEPRSRWHWLRRLLRW